MFLSDDDMVECPYNKTHRMLRRRLQSHLIKCRLNYPDVELRKCPFNITHLIPEPEFTHHATNCPDRKLITQYKYNAPEPKEEEGPKHAPIECDEDWDDTDVNDYNPQKYLERAKVIRKPDGHKPSERKLFIKKERKRLGDGDDSSEDESKSKGSKSTSHGYKRKDEDSQTESPTKDTVKGNRSKYSRSPSRSSSYKGRSRSPSYRSRRDRSRSPSYRSRRDRSPSPAGFRRSYRNHSPPRRGSPDYSRHYSPPPNSIGRTLYSYNSDQDPYYNGGVNNKTSFSGRDAFYNGNHSQINYDCNEDTNSIMPQAPPPPMISYPAPRSYLTAKQPSSSLKD
ncbi:uncharacterized protein ACRADG_007678 [Cochliomyia hominivorax]